MRGVSWPATPVTWRCIPTARVEGKEIQSWGSATDTPKLDGKELLSDKRPLRWLRETLLPPYDASAETTGLIELAGGDQLPCRVVGFEEGRGGPMGSEPPHLVAMLKDGMGPPQVRTGAKLRVQPRFVRRIVWGKGSPRTLEPGTLFYTDGRRLVFQGIRWQRESIRVLLEDGIRQVFLGELAESISRATTLGKATATSWPWSIPIAPPG